MSGSSLDTEIDFGLEIKLNHRNQIIYRRTKPVFMSCCSKIKFTAWRKSAYWWSEDCTLGAEEASQHQFAYSTDKNTTKGNAS